MKPRHLISGIVCWLLILVTGYLATRAELDHQSSSVTQLGNEVQQWVTGARQTQQAASEIPLLIALHDPVFAAAEDGRFVQAGYVSDVDGTRSRHPQAVTQVQVTLYDSAADQFPDGYRLEYCTTPMNLDWVVRMIIPEQRRQEIRQLIEAEWEIHQQDVMRELQPVMAQGIQRATDAVEAELPGIINAHREEFRRIGSRFEAEIMREQLLPLVREEVFPVIQEEAEPLVRDIGRALWDRVSLVSFTWRYLYDISPLPERDAVNTEFQRFIDGEAIPELESRSEEIIQVTRSVIDRVMRNERVRNTLRNNTQQVLEDPELRRIIGEIVREATIDNVRLRQELREFWNSRETQTAVRMASARLEKMVRAIGDLVFGTRESGITPEFSRILRSQVLRKDRRWFVMTAAESSTGAEAVDIALAREPMLYPLKFAGQHQSPLTPEGSLPDDSDAPDP